MSDNYIGPERRSSEQAWSTFAKQLANLHADVGDIKAGMADFKDGMKELAAAILKLALVEERQANTAQALERAFKLLEKLDQKVDSVAERVHALEKSEPMQAKTSEWVERLLWAAASAALMFIAAKSGLVK